MGRDEHGVGVGGVMMMKKIGLMAAVILFCFAAAHFMSGQAFAQTSSSTNAENAPVFGGIVVHQAGSNLLLIEIKGVNLPAPKITTSDSGHMIFFFEGASIPADRWTRSYTYPLLNGVEVVNVEGGLELRLFTTQLLEVKEMTGTPPAPLYRLQLKVPGQEVTELPKKEEKPFPLALQTGPKDPMAISSPVTLELRDTELKDLLRMLAKFMQMNVIIDPSVPPNTVTLSVKDAPLREVLSYVMRMNNLNYAMMGNTILFGTPENLGKSLGMEQTKSYKIAYADPKQVPAILQSLVGITNVAVDERLRTVYVTGRLDNLRDVEQLLQRIDHPGRQVMLQARLIEVRDTGRKELESIVDAVYKHWWFSYGAGGGSIGYTNASEPDKFDPVNRPTSPQGVDLVDITNGTLRLLDVGIRNLVESNKADILASPSVVTVDGQKASIALTTNIKYISERDDAGNPVYSEERVGPKLDFTPIVGRDDTVTINVAISTGEVVEWRPGGMGEEVPVTSSREVTTMVRVRNGEPFVIGGLFDKRKTDTVSRVPVLSDIPLLGEIFKTRSKRDEESEVVTVVVPYILDVPDTAIEMSELGSLSSDATKK
ncbi:type II secretory pathway, component PulD [Acetomicrobium mobile DSM 13181]|uniref:Type II secretory pathway, component PulD n=1 Tax=Acetomicrobium mobile (strain ATCC BAA-54 / DSM 13181 / JCM 12221 / NGA) TaxID=891968 RepID=I4BZ75_ACEMN|nr:type II secretory pathway, component PulD [Acetomicrobium mobile DSM 13181]